MYLYGLWVYAIFFFFNNAQDINYFIKNFTNC